MASSKLFEEVALISDTLATDIEPPSGVGSVTRQYIADRREPAISGSTAEAVRGRPAERARLSAQAHAEEPQ
jgi:hypothetical protein